MLSVPRSFRRPFAVLLASSLSSAVALSMRAESGKDGSDAPVAGDVQPASDEATSESVTVNLIKKLAKRGVLTKQDSAELLAVAEADAAEAKAQAALTQAALAQAAAAQARMRVLALQLRMHRAKNVAAEDADTTDSESEETAPPPRVKKIKPPREVAEAPAEDSPEMDAPPPPPAPRHHAKSKPAPPQNVDEQDNEEVAENTPAPRAKPAPRKVTPSDEEMPTEPTPPLGEDEVRVAYVPESVKNELREEVKQDVMETARKENWASPRLMPDWVLRFRLFGDLRFRYDGLLYPSGNDTGSGSPFWNINAINTASTPFDYKGLASPPFYNVDQDRRRIRLRTRLGAEVDMSEGFTAGLRMATGDSNSPVTENQTLGGANNAQGGNFSKYPIWLDRAFLKYELWGQPDDDLTFTIGRFDNPFVSTNMIWADDLGFDGLAAKWKIPASESVTPFVTAGIFPVFNTDLNFGSTNSSKFKSEDKWLYAAQIGTNLDLGNAVSVKVAAAYYYFQNVQGRVSTPFTPVTAQDVGDTDDTRPSFAQRGNTYIALRDILLDSTNSGSNGVTNQWQYFGLASPFHEAAGNLEVDFNQFAPFQIAVFGEYVKNLAFDANAIENSGPASLKGPINNNAKNGTTFAGSGTAYNFGIRVGHAALEQRWDWNTTLSYRRVGSDSVIDGFNDSDFGGGGTNQQGFVVGGSLAMAKNVWISARWMGATQLAGPTFKSDTFQFDINGKF